MGLKGYFIQYKFILPNNVKHSSYTYQKLFRALYGYSQAVSKSNGKTYLYHRHGVLSKAPYIKHGKNCVIIQPAVFQDLANFFKTGKNPAHNWTTKGDWKAVYYLNEKDLDELQVISAVEEWIDRTFIVNPSREPALLLEELKRIKQEISEGRKVDQAYQKALFEKTQSVVGTPWFKAVFSKSPKLKDFHSLCSFLRAQH